jgi:hypothetical protein
VRKPVALALFVLAVSIIVSACGGTQGVSSTSTTGKGLRTAIGRRTPTDPHKSCDAQGINSRALRVGACTEQGVQYVVGNYGSVVRLKTLAVAITGVGVAPADEGNGQRALPRRAAFLSIKLQIQNRDKVPHRFELSQTMLGVGADDYLESTNVERHVHGESLAVVNGGRIGPGETLRGDVVFDITEADYAALQREGRFFIWNFGEHAALSLARQKGQQLGQIRLYAVEGNRE